MNKLNEKDIAVYSTILDIKDLTKERIDGIRFGNGFRIRTEYNSKPKTLHSEENEYSILSSKYGMSPNDMSVVRNTFKCRCGSTIGNIMKGTLCPNCRTEVKYIGESFDYFGWIVLDNHKYIHPQMFFMLYDLFGKSLMEDIISVPDDNVDEDGNKISTKTNKNPYSGIGMIKFHQKFDEIMNYFFEKNFRKKPKKLEKYHFIMEKYDYIWTDSFPVYTTQLRPAIKRGTEFTFDEVNNYFTIMTREASMLNKNDDTIISHEHIQNRILYDFQKHVFELYTHIYDKVLKGKYGEITNIISGRSNFTSRCVIIPDDTLRIDEVNISYFAAVKVLELKIINILVNVKGISYSDARNEWEKSQHSINPTIYGIIKDLIKNHKSGRGIPVLTNRNPTIEFGSILQVYVVDINDAYALKIPLESCRVKNADFDGDSENVLWILNDEFEEETSRIINPRNNFFIDHTTGRFNPAVGPFVDVYININRFIKVQEGYTQEELDNIERIKNKAKV